MGVPSNHSVLPNRFDIVSTLNKVWKRRRGIAAGFVLISVLHRHCVADPDSARTSVFDRPGLQAAQTAVSRSAVILFAQRKYAEAEEQLRAALERMPSDAYGHYNLACALARQGRDDEALATLRAMHGDKLPTWMQRIEAQAKDDPEEAAKGLLHCVEPRFCG